jgi:hypothetical protein
MLHTRWSLVLIEQAREGNTGVASFKRLALAKLFGLFLPFYGMIMRSAAKVSPSIDQTARAWRRISGSGLVLLAQNAWSQM